jgi:hypothetical protein
MWHLEQTETFAEFFSNAKLIYRRQGTYIYDKLIHISSSL